MPIFILLLSFHLYLDLSSGLLIQILQQKLYIYFSSISLSLFHSLCLMHATCPRPLSSTSICSSLQYLKIFMWRNCRARDNMKTKVDDYFSSPDCHICFQDSLCYSLYKVLTHDFHVTKHFFCIQFPPHSKHSHILVRFESLMLMLVTTHLYLNVMQCRLVYKYQLSPISDSSWTWKLGQSLSWRWDTPWKCCYFYAPVHVFIFKTNGISTHDLHYKSQLGKKSIFIFTILQNA